MGEVLGGGVLFDTAKWDKLYWKTNVFFLLVSRDALLQFAVSVEYWRDCAESSYGRQTQTSTPTYFVCCKLPMFWWFQLDRLMTSELMEKSCAPNVLNAGYGKPVMPGVCSATTGVLSDDCCRCYRTNRTANWMFSIIWHCVRHNKHNNKWRRQLTSLYEMSSLGCSPVLFIGPGMTTRKFEFRTCAPGECCLCPR